MACWCVTLIKNSTKQGLKNPPKAIKSEKMKKSRPYEKKSNFSLKKFNKLVSLINSEQSYEQGYHSTNSYGVYTACQVQSMC